MMMLAKLVYNVDFDVLALVVCLVIDRSDDNAVIRV